MGQEKPASNRMNAGQLNMIKSLPIAIASGLASALLFGTLSSGTPLALILFYLAPLPIFIAGLGWGHRLASIAALVGCGVIFVITAEQLAMLYLGAVALPAALLCFFALLSRQTDTQTEWYPLGRLVMVASFFAAGFVVLALALLGGDIDVMYKNINEMVTALVSQNQNFKELQAQNPDMANRFVAMAVKFAPAGAAAMWLVSTLVNMFLGQKLLQMSKKAIRTEAAISEMVYPNIFLYCFAGSLALAFIGGIPGLVGGAFAAVGIMAYAILGFVVIHNITAGHTFQPLILGFTYLVVLLFSWLALVVIMAVGLVDSFFGLRQKFGKKL